MSVVAMAQGDTFHKLARYTHRAFTCVQYKIRHICHALHYNENAYLIIKLMTGRGNFYPYHDNGLFGEVECLAQL